MSKILQTCFWIWFGLMPFLQILFWCTDGLSFMQPFYKVNFIPVFYGDGDMITPITAMSYTTKMMGMLVSLIPVAIDMMAIYAVIRLFRLFATNEYFTSQTVRWIRRAGIYLLANQLFYPIYMALISLSLTFQNPPGKRMLSIGFGDEQLTLAVVALTILLISWIMDEGRKMNEDLQGTV